MNIKKSSEGAESQIYSGNFLGFDGILKRRIAKKYRLSQIDEKLRTQRTKDEARILSLVSTIGIGSPEVILVDKYEIYMTRISGAMLNDLLDSKRKIDFEKVFDILGKYAAILHQNNITHGDYTPANIIIGSDEKPYLIDFGLAEITNSAEEKALDLLLMKRSISKVLFDRFIKSYKKNGKESELIIKRLAKIEKRGRYNVRSLLTA